MKTKKAPAKAVAPAKRPPFPRKPASDWQTLCASLMEERERMCGDLALLRAENKMLRENLYALMFDDVEIDKEKMLTEARNQPTIDDIIAELRGKVQHNGKRR